MLLSSLSTQSLLRLSRPGLLLSRSTRSGCFSMFLGISTLVYLRTSSSMHWKREAQRQELRARRCSHSPQLSHLPPEPRDGSSWPSSKLGLREPIRCVVSLEVLHWPLTFSAIFPVFMIQILPLSKCQYLSLCKRSQSFTILESIHGYKGLSLRLARLFFIYRVAPVGTSRQARASPSCRQPARPGQASAPVALFVALQSSSL